MNQTIEVKVPDIGDFKDVAVIEIFVKPGDKVEAEQSLITLETDKAAMEVPCPSTGVVTALKVRVGDKVSQGSVILTLDQLRGARSEDRARPAASATVPAAAPNKSTAPAPAQSPAPAPDGTASQSTSLANNASQVAGYPPFKKGDIHAEVLVLGAGPGGYTAAFRAADPGQAGGAGRKICHPGRRVFERRLRFRPRRCCMSPK